MVQRIAWITQPLVIRRILDAVGLPAASPEPHPARSLDECFDEPSSAVNHSSDLEILLLGTQDILFAG